MRYIECSSQTSCGRKRKAKTTQTPPGPIHFQILCEPKMHFPPSTMHWLQAQLECGPGKGGSSGTRQRGAKEAALNCAARGLNARADAHFCDSSSQGVVGDQRGMPGRARQCHPEKGPFENRIKSHQMDRSHYSTKFAFI